MSLLCVFLTMVSEESWATSRNPKSLFVVVIVLQAPPEDNLPQQEAIQKMEFLSASRWLWKPIAQATIPKNILRID